MRVSYDREADALLVELSDAAPDHGIDLEDGVTLEVTEDGHIVALEILDASARLGAGAVAKIVVEGLPAISAELVAAEPD